MYILCPRGVGARALGFGFFIPVFFIHVGLSVSLPSLASGGALWFALQLAAVSCAAKVPPALLLRAAGLGGREALASGLLLSAPLTLVVAIGAAGYKLRVFDDAALAGTMLYAVLSGVVYPTLARAALALGRGAQPGEATAPATRQAAGSLTTG